MKKKIIIFGTAILLMAAGTIYALNAKSNSACPCGSSNCVCTSACCVADSKCCEKGNCSEDGCCNDNCCKAACCK